MRRLVPIVVAALATTAMPGCGEDGSAGPRESRSEDADDTSWCRRLDADGKPTAELTDAVPERHRVAAELVVAFAGAKGGDGPAVRSAEEFASSVTGEEPAFADFATAIETSCGERGAETIRALAALTTMATLAAEPLDITYCTALTVVVTADSDEMDMRDLPAALAALSDRAPASHQPVLLEIGAAAPAPPATVEEQSALVAKYGGIGLYAEAVCGARGGLLAMTLAGAFAQTDMSEEG